MNEIDPHQPEENQKSSENLKATGGVRCDNGVVIASFIMRPNPVL
jgi:hypothetical protein